VLCWARSGTDVRLETRPVCRRPPPAASWQHVGGPNPDATCYDCMAVSLRFRMTHTVGLMFALRRKKLAGSYLFFKPTSRS
jgi:hypothetical protein